MYQATINSRTEFNPPLVSLDDVKDQVYVDQSNTDYDSILTFALNHAQAMLEDGTDRLFVDSANVTFQSSWFPYGYEMQRLPYPPLLAVSEIKYTDREYNTVIIDPTAYDVTAGENGGVVPREVWPTALAPGYSVEISYTCGYQGAVPDELAKRFILVQCAEWFKNRELTTDQTVNQLPIGFAEILERLKAGDEFFSFQ